MASFKVTPFLIFRICELILGVVCFGLFAEYGLLFMTSYDDTRPKIIAKIGIGCVAADAFPFLVQIPFLIAYWKHGTIFQHNILNPIVNLIGFIVYLTSGAMGIRYAIYLSEVSNVNNYSTQEKAVGSMFVITGIVYLADFIFWVIKLRKEP